MELSKSKISWLLNKWLIAIVLFVLLFTFDSDNGMVVYFKYKHKLSVLKKQEKYLTNKIQANKERLNDLYSSQKNLEKFAREEFLMHKENEDVFIVIENDNN